MSRSGTLHASLAASILLWPAAGWAEGGADAQRFRPALGGSALLMTTDTAVGEAWQAGGGSTFSFARAPVTVRYEDQDDTVLVDDLGTLNAVAWINGPRVRLGVDAPLHLLVDGAAYSERPGVLGDLRLELAGELIRRRGDGVGLGARIHATAPTGSAEDWLGAPAARVGGGLLASAAAGPVTLLANADVRTSGLEAVQSELDDKGQVDLGVGAAFSLSPGAQVAVEASGARYLGTEHPSAAPAELLGSLLLAPTSHLRVRLGGGPGLSSGLGAPQWRAVAGLAWVPERPEPVATGAIATTAAGPDQDGDGVPDSRDRCPEQAEDLNGVEDTDGCPDEGLTPSTLVAAGEDGRHLVGAKISLLEGPVTGAYTLTEGEVTRSLPVGRYQVQVSAAGHATTTATLDIPDARRHQRIFTLQDVAGAGDVLLTVRGPDGAPVAATVRVVGDASSTMAADRAGILAARLPAGAYAVIVSADGFRPAEKAISLTEGGSASLEVVLQPARVTLTDDRLVLMDRIFFELDSDVIKPESYPLLDEIAETLIRHGEVRGVQIEGHTDDQGSDDYNLSLSQARADSVRRYLVNTGIDAERLEAVGRGEREPLVAETTASARATNRRVEFHITHTEEAAR